MLLHPGGPHTHTSWQDRKYLLGVPCEKWQRHRELCLLFCILSFVPLILLVVGCLKENKSNATLNLILTYHPHCSRTWTRLCSLRDVGTCVISEATCLPGPSTMFGILEAPRKHSLVDIHLMQTPRDLI